MFDTLALRRFLHDLFPRGIFQRHDRRVHILVLCRGITALGFSVVFPFLSIYFHNVLKVPMTTVGTVFLTAILAGAVAELLGGELADRFGRKVVMLLALGARAGTFFLISAAVLREMGFLPIAGLVVASSFSRGLFEPAALAMVSDVTTPEKRQEAYAFLRIGINLGWAIGPAMGGFLASFSYAFLFSVSGIVTALGGLILLVAMKEPERGTGAERVGLRDLVSVARDRLFLSYNLISVLLFVVASQLIMVFSVYAVEWVGITKVSLGYLYTANGLIVVFLQFPCVKLVERLRMTRVMALGSLLYAVGYFSASLAGGFHSLLAAIVIVTLGEILTGPASIALVANLAPATRYGRYMGVFGLFSSLGFSIGPFMGGLVMDVSAGNRLIVWGLIGLVGLAASLGFLLLGNRLPAGVDRPGAEIPVGAVTAPDDSVRGPASP
ncbi:MAG: MFS transporter [Candidatus Eiseniibacteriota bacterium]|nr:MAG: MFS transporter [Candidatus Eisenbacteria bacterium]